MPQIFVVNKERRDWDNQDKSVLKERRKCLVPTQRYLFVVDHPEITRVLKKEFSLPPNAVYPHESRKDFLFYCVVGASGRKISDLVGDIFHKLRKSNLSSTDLNELEILTA